MTIPDPSVVDKAGAALSWDSLESLLAYLQAFAKQHGYAVIKKRTDKRLGDDKPYRVVFGCDRGGVYKSTSRQIRPATSAKTGCMWEACRRAYHDLGGNWAIQLHGQHNHEPSLHPSAHPTHRKLTNQQKDTSAGLFRRPAIRLREAASAVRKDDPGALFTDKDLSNYKQKLHKKALNGLTPTQALVALFDEQGVYHRVLVHGDRLAGIFWTYPVCMELWRRYNSVVSFDNTYKTNQFGMPLFNITGQTGISTTFNVGFGLIYTEKQAGFD